MLRDDWYTQTTFSDDTWAQVLWDQSKPTATTSLRADAPSRVDRLRLPFYCIDPPPLQGADPDTTQPRDVYLYRLSIDLGLPPVLTTADDKHGVLARAFAVVVTSDAPTTDEDTLTNGHPSITWLNGTSSPIHSLNNTLRVSLKSPTDYSPESLDSPGSPVKGIHPTDLYLRFFCEFVHGDEGPFLLPHHHDDLWHDNADLDLHLFAKRRVDLWTKTGNPADGEDGTQNIIDQLSDIFRNDWTFKNNTDSEQHVWTTNKRVCYGKHLFDARFGVHASGMVEMLEDSQRDYLLPPRSVARNTFARSSRQWLTNTHPTLNAWVKDVARAHSRELRFKATTPDEASDHEELSPSELLKRLRRGEKVQNAIVTGDVLWPRPGNSEQQPTTFTNSEGTGCGEGDDQGIDGPNEPHDDAPCDADFPKGVSLADTNIRGRLDLRGRTFCASIDLRNCTAAHLDLTNTSIEGSVQLDQCTIEDGSATFSNANIGGDLHILNTWVRRHIDASSLLCRDSVRIHNCNAISGVFHNVRTQGDFNTSTSCFSSLTDQLRWLSAPPLSDTVSASLDLRDGRIGGRLHIALMTVGGSISLQGLSAASSLTLNADVQGDVNLLATRSSGWIWIYDSHVHGAINAGLVAADMLRLETTRGTRLPRSRIDGIIQVWKARLPRGFEVLGVETGDSISLQQCEVGLVRVGSSANDSASPPRQPPPNSKEGPETSPEASDDAGSTSAATEEQTAIGSNSSEEEGVAQSFNTNATESSTQTTASRSKNSPLDSGYSPIPTWPEGQHPLNVEGGILIEDCQCTGSIELFGVAADPSGRIDRWQMTQGLLTNAQARTATPRGAITVKNSRVGGSLRIQGRAAYLRENRFRPTLWPSLHGLPLMTPDAPVRVALRIDIHQVEISDILAIQDVNAGRQEQPASQIQDVNAGRQEQPASRIQADNDDRREQPASRIQADNDDRREQPASRTQADKDGSQGRISLLNLRVGGDIDFRPARWHVEIDRDKWSDRAPVWLEWANKWKDNVHLVECRLLEILNVSCGGDVHLSGLSTETNSKTHTNSTSNNDTLDSSRPHVYIKNLRASGSLDFCVDALPQGSWEGKEEDDERHPKATPPRGIGDIPAAATTVHGDMRLTNCTIGGDIDLRATYIKGSLYATDISVGGRIDAFRAVMSLPPPDSAQMEPMRLGLLASEDSKSDSAGSQQSIEYRFVHVEERVILEDLACEGNVDLRGLWVGGDRLRTDDVALNIRRLRAQGRLMLTFLTNDRADAPPRRPRKANQATPVPPQYGGAIHVSQCRTETIEMCLGLQGFSPKADDQFGLDLEGSKADRLVLSHLPSTCDPEGRDLRIRFDGFSARDWDLGLDADAPEQGPQLTDTTNIFAMLCLTETRSGRTGRPRQLFLDLEQWLKNQQRDFAAEQVRRWMATDALQGSLTCIGDKHHKPMSLPWRLFGVVGNVIRCIPPLAFLLLVVLAAIHSCRSTLEQRARRATKLGPIVTYLLLRWFGYGRLIGSVATLLGIWACATWLLFDPNNIVPSVEAVATNTPTIVQKDTPLLQDRTPLMVPPSRRPTDDQWGLASAGLLALEYTLPMMDWPIREEWRPSPYSKPLPSVGASTETLVGLLALGAWLTWPVLLFSIISLARRVDLQ